MEKAIHSPEYQSFLRVLKKVREDRGVTQIELAKRLSEAHSSITQSLVSKLERGEVRIDVIQLRWICRALGISLSAFVESLEKSLPKRSNK
jgi:transcriptional regulator with XRE-family HTH domain